MASSMNIMIDILCQSMLNGEISRRGFITVGFLGAGVVGVTALGALALRTASLLQLDSQPSSMAQASAASEAWKPPEINYCGHNMQDYFARMLAQEVAAMMLMAHPQGAIHTGMDEIVKEMNAISDSLREKNCYTYPDGKRSVFTDYKVMLEKYEENLGIKLGKKVGREAIEAGYKEIRSMFNPRMTAYEALRLAKDIVTLMWP